MIEGSVLSENVISVLALIEFVSIIAILVTNSKLRDNFSKLDGKYKKLKVENKSLQDNDSIIPGDKAHFTASLTIKDDAGTEHPFKVIYEFDILEVSHDKVKISPYDVKAENRLPIELTKNNNYKQNLIDYQMGKWIDKSEISPLMSIADIRDRKLNKLID